MTGIGHGASNEWVIAGSRTETGKPILANDPHLDLSAPILWYLARVVTPEGSVKGATIPGGPGLRPRPERFDRLGADDRGLERRGPVRRDRRSERSRRTISRPTDRSRSRRREETIHVKGARRRQAHDPDDPPRSCAVRRQRGRRKRRRARDKVVALAFTGLGDRDHDRRSIPAPQRRSKLGRVSRRAAPLPDANPEPGLRGCRRKYRLLQPRPRADAKVRRRSRSRSTARRAPSTGLA